MTDTIAMRFERHGRSGLRLAMVVIFLVFGAQKFTAVEAMGIASLVAHSPLTSWLLSLGIRDASRAFGTAELSFGLLLATGLWREDVLPAILGAAGSCVTFLTTLSFLLTTPGVFAKDAAPVLSSDGLFLVKDLALLAASVLLMANSLAARERRTRAVSRQAGIDRTRASLSPN